MLSVNKKYQEVCQNIVRPYRESYQPSQLGPSNFTLGEKSFTRQDFQLTNSRSLKLQCSFYKQQVDVPLPCVIYLHTHTGSRLEAQPLLNYLLPSNINILTFDFSGSGLSEGEYVSLGWFEREDIDCVIRYLRDQGLVTCIGLWGRGMGAVAALLYADRDPCIGGMVLDSPFSSLTQLCSDTLSKLSSLPGFIKSTALSFLRSQILETVKFDIKDLNTLEHSIQTFVPALFCRGKSDDFILPHHLEQVYEGYLGEKKLTQVDGHHTSERPGFFLDSVGIFFYNTLLCESINLSSSVLEKKVDSDDSFEIL